MGISDRAVGHVRQPKITVRLRGFEDGLVNFRLIFRLGTEKGYSLQEQRFPSCLKKLHYYQLSRLILLHSLGGAELAVRVAEVDRFFFLFVLPRHPVYCSERCISLSFVTYPFSLVYVFCCKHKRSLYLGICSRPCRGSEHYLKSKSVTNH